MATTFNDDEAYELFLFLDTLARVRKGEDRAVNYFRERLLPTYRAWHQANPFKVHPAFRIPTPPIRLPHQPFRNVMRVRPGFVD